MNDDILKISLKRFFNYSNTSDRQLNSFISTTHPLPLPCPSFFFVAIILYMNFYYHTSNLKRSLWLHRHSFSFQNITTKLF